MAALMSKDEVANIACDLWMNGIDSPYFMRRQNGGFIGMSPDLSGSYRWFEKDIDHVYTSVHFITDAANFDEACLRAVLDRGGKAWAFKETGSLVFELRRSQLSYAWLQHSMWVCGVIPVIKDER